MISSISLHLGFFGKYMLTQNKYLKIHKPAKCQIRKSYANHFFKTNLAKK